MKKSLFTFSILTFAMFLNGCTHKPPQPYGKPFFINSQNQSTVKFESSTPSTKRESRK